MAAKKPKLLTVVKKVPGVFDRDGKTVVFAEGDTVSDDDPAGARARELYPDHFS